MVATALLATHAQASVVEFGSNSGATGRGSFSGSLEWIYSRGAGNGSVLVTFTNTSALANGGFLTGFAFNAVDGVNVAFSSEISNGTARRWRALSNLSVRGYGSFESGAAVGGRWRKGGNVIYGVSVGRTKVFAFDVLGDAELLSALAAQSFLDESNGIGMIARFRGFDDGGSDTVTATLPAPGAIAVLGLGAGLFRRSAR
jgi:hypothetical protein